MHPIIVFLLGVLGCVVVVYGAKILIDYLELDAPIRKIVMLILALLVLIVLVGLIANVLGFDLGLGLRPVHY